MSAEAQNKSSKIIFGSDGIRGIVDEWPFTPEGMAQIGLILGRFIQKKSEDPLVFIGRDTRPSGLEFVNQLKARLSKYDIPVWDLGIAPTPVIAYSVKHYSASLGIIVSASHNPIQYNGIKLVNSNGLRCQLNPGELFEDLIEEAKLTPCNISKREGVCAPTLFVQNYIHDHAKMLGNTSLEGMKIVVDCSNGAVSMTAPILLRNLRASVIARNINRSSKRGINENCGSEHVREDPTSLIKLVRNKNADYGIAFDGDGDRIVVVDKEGNFYNGDDLLYVLATQQMINGHLPTRTVVITENANSGLEESLRARGIKAVVSKNGDKNLEEIIWKNGYLLGSEQVGNIIINDGYHGAADPLFATALIFKKLKLGEKSLKDSVESFDKYPQIRVSIHMNRIFSKEEIQQVKKKVERRMKSSHLKRVLTWNSSTEEKVFNIMIESEQRISLQEISNTIITILRPAETKFEEHIVALNVLDLSTRQRL